MAWLNGKGACRDAVEVGLREGDDYALEDLIEDREVTTPPLPEKDPFILTTNDGGEVVASKASLRRRYQLIDDYLSDFPEETSMAIPYSKEVLEATVSCKGMLCDVYDCLSHLNPFSAMYYLYHDTKGTSAERIIQVARLCTEEEVSSILDSIEENSLQPPHHGLGVNFLGVVLQAYKDGENAQAIFSAYPSYLTAFYCSVGDKVRFASMILTADYGAKKEYNKSVAVWHHIVDSIISIVFAQAKTKEEAKRVIDMLSPTSSDRVYAPYLDHYRHRLEDTRLDGWLRSIVKRAAGLLEVEENVLMERLFGRV